MAVGLPKVGTARTLGGRLMCPGSIGSEWIRLNGDAKTAQAAGDLLNPALADDAGVFWTKVPEGTTRINVRFGYTGTLGTLPVVRLFGAWGTPNALGVYSNTTTDANYGVFDRIDSPTNVSAAGIELSGGGASPLTDATNKWGPRPSAVGWDHLGAMYVAALVETAAATVTLGWIDATFF